MKYFTISSRGRRGHNFDHMGYMYQLDIDMFGKYVDFYIYADNRRAAIESAKKIVSTITSETTVKDIQTEVDKQNGLQQLNVAYKMLETHKDKEKVLNYIQRLKVHFNIADETTEEPDTIANITVDAQLIQASEKQSNTSLTTKTEPEPTIEHSEPEVFYLYSNTFTTYWNAYNYAMNNRIDAADMIISSKASITNEQLLKLKSEYVSSKYSMSYEDILMYYNYMVLQPSNYHVNEMLDGLKRLKERHESRIEAEKKRHEDQIKMIQQYDKLLQDMYNNGMTKVENGNMVKYYINDECVYTFFSGISVSKLYNDLLEIYNNKFKTVTT